jgi:hypothetical protein
VCFSLPFLEYCGWKILFRGRTEEEDDDDDNIGKQANEHPQASSVRGSRFKLLTGFNYIYAPFISCSTVRSLTLSTTLRLTGSNQIPIPN